VTQTQTIAASPWPGFRKPLPAMVAIVFKPLHAAIASPVLIFLVALSAMLFRPPDLKTFPLDRVAFLVLIAVFALRLCLRRERPQTYAATWPMLALMLLAMWGALGESNAPQAWSLLTAKWIVPFTLFHMAGSIFRDQGSLRKLENFSVVVLSYLALVSVFFLLDAKPLIFPRFILDEGIGIHADRARGPMLQAVANGVCLNILGLVALDSFRRRMIRGIWPPLLFLMVPLALLATKTRTVWLSAALCVSYLALFGSHRRVCRPALALCAIAGIAFCGALVYETDAGALNDRVLDRSPVEFRLEMYQTGWQMFTEKPFAGWGSEANIQPEIAKRVTGFHPERYLFHNTYLELAVERGVIGLGLYVWLMVSLFRLAKRPASNLISEGQFLDAQFRRLWPVILMVYVLNASAVVMNYQFVNGFLFTLAGILAAQNAGVQQYPLTKAAR
jgi:putative inorganic carbon (HCO3(-)) transporter